MKKFNPLIWFLVILVILSLFFWGYYVIPRMSNFPTVDLPPEIEIENVIECSADTYNCADFTTCDEVTEIFESCSSDVHRLDNNGDGIPCENLCG